MIQSLLLMFREGLEAALIVGIILGYLTRIDARGSARAVWTGVAAAVGTSLIAGGILFLAVGELEGTAEQVYEGVAMLLAVVVLTWMVFWMRRQARTVGAELRSRVDVALATGSAAGLASVAFIAVAREGLEAALFFFASARESSLGAALVGGALGLALAIAVGVAINRGTARLDLRRFFNVPSALLLAFATYLLWGAVEELAEAGALPEAGEGLAVVAALGYAAAIAWLYYRRPAVASAGRA